MDYSGYIWEICYIWIFFIWRSDVYDVEYLSYTPGSVIGPRIQ